jgi:hypothetical protein
MFELGKKHPEVWQQYTAWAKDTRGSELINKDIKDLGAIPENSGVSIGWDPKNHRFMTQSDVNPKDAAIASQYRGGSSTGPSSYYGTVDTIVNRMNNNLYNYKHIAEASGQDVDAFLIKSIADSAGPDMLRNVQGIPFKLIREMGLTRLGGYGR